VLALSQNRVNVQIDPGAIFTRRSIPRVPPFRGRGVQMRAARRVIAQNTACPPRRALAFVGCDARAPPWTNLQLSRQRPAVSDHHARLRYDETDRLRASAAVHDRRETPSAIPLKPASTIAEIRSRIMEQATGLISSRSIGGVLYLPPRASATPIRKSASSAEDAKSPAPSIPAPRKASAGSSRPESLP
jgi:hypothetical protein